MKLGFISARFESGGMGPGIISKAGDDPGGKSYGTYQLSKTTLLSYLAQSPFKFCAQAFTEEFDNEWRSFAEDYTLEFGLDQYLFITKKLYLPNILVARTIGYDTWSRRIQEAIYSTAVQHGAAEKLIRKAFVSNVSVAVQVDKLYATRSEYVRGLNLSDALRRALLKRYLAEQRAVMSIEECDYESVQ